MIFHYMVSMGVVRFTNNNLLLSSKVPMLAYLNLHFLVCHWYNIGSIKINTKYANIGLSFHIFTNVIPTWNLKFFPVEPARGFLGDEGQSHCFTAT